MFIKGVFDLLADITSSRIEAQSVTQAGQAAIFDAVAKTLNTLTSRESTVIRLYYGLDDGERKTPEQIGSLFNASGQRAEDIRHETLRKLRVPERLQRIQNAL